MKKYIAIGHLIQDLELAYVAATRARQLAHKLVCQVNKRKSPRPDKLEAARKQKSRATANWNRIRAELKRYQKMVTDALMMIAYDGVISGRYENAKTITCFEMSKPPKPFLAKLVLLEP